MGCLWAAHSVRRGTDLEELLDKVNSEGSYIASYHTGLAQVTQPAGFLFPVQPRRRRTEVEQDGAGEGGADGLGGLDLSSLFTACQRGSIPLVVYTRARLVYSP